MTIGEAPFWFSVRKFDDPVGLWKNFRYIEDWLQKIRLEDRHSYEVIVKPSNSSSTQTADVILDGATDAATINALIDDDGVKSFFFLDGTVNLEDNIFDSLNLSGGYHFRGSGMQVTTFKMTAAARGWQASTGSSAHVFFYDFTWDGDGTGSSMLSTFITENTWAAHLRGIEIKDGTNDGLQFQTAGGSRLNTVTDCYIHDNAGSGVLVSNLPVIVVGSWIDNNSVDGVEVANDSSASASVLGNYIESNTGKSVSKGASGVALVVGNYLSNNGTDAPEGTAGFNNVGGTPTTVTLSHDTDLTDVSADDHHSEAHTVASHSDTTATGTELETLTDGSDADSLHTHSAFLENVVEDTTPQLGGDLDVNGKKIVSTSNGDIDIEPNGTGNIILGVFSLDADQAVGAGQDDYVLTYDNATGLISLEAASGGGLTQEQVEDIVGAMLDGNTETGIAVTYQDADGTIDFVVDHDAADNFVANEHIDWTQASAGTIHATNYVDNDTQLTEGQVEDFVGGMVTGNTETLITVTYEGSDGTLDFVVDNDLANYSNATSGFLTDITGETLDSLSDVDAHTPTKGHLLVGDGDSWNVLAVGSDGEVLHADSAQATGLAWDTDDTGGGGSGEVAHSLLLMGA